MGGNVSLIDGHIDGIQTNYDRIRNMSVEELAEILSEMGKQMEICVGCPAELFCAENYVKLQCKNCNDLILKWLESEVDTE